MADDHFSTQAPTIIGPAIGAFAITPSDGSDLADPVRAITVGTAGTVSFISSRDNVTYTTESLPAGTYSVFAKRVLSTGTTATSLTGWI